MGAFAGLLRSLRRRERDCQDVALRCAWRDPYRAEVEHDRAREAGAYADAIAAQLGERETIHDPRQMTML